MAERIRRANKVGDFLTEQGLPARQTFSPKILALKGQRAIKFAAIYHYLPGNTIPWEAYTMERIKALGGAMGTMHAALYASTIVLPSVLDELNNLHERMRQYFTDLPASRALHQKLGLAVASFNFTTTLRACSALSAQPLHMDFVRGNILFNGNDITGILDFEKTASGPPIIDLARTLAFLLVDCKYKAEPKIRKYFIESGYIKRGGGTVGNAALLERLISLFLLHDFYKFLRHNPYEYLPQNEHFTRTRAILLQRGLIGVK